MGKSGGLIVTARCVYSSNVPVNIKIKGCPYKQTEVNSSVGTELVLKNAEMADMQHLILTSGVLASPFWW